jgi:hypothetical protein
MKPTKSKSSSAGKASPDIERLKLWKRSSTKAKLNWLESAFYFGKLKKFR